MDKQIYRTRTEADRVSAGMRGWMTRIIRWTDYRGEQGWVIECHAPGADAQSAPAYMRKDGYVR
jgi:hypothetical protein